MKRKIIFGIVSLMICLTLGVGCFYIVKNYLPSTPTSSEITGEEGTGPIGDWSNPKFQEKIDPVQTISSQSTDSKTIEDEVVYNISNGAQLAYLANLINGKSQVQSGELKSNAVVNQTYTIKLANDIDLSAHYWNSINDFKGTFDGQNHKIEGIYIKNGQFDSEKNQYFSFIDKAEGTIKDTEYSGEINAIVSGDKNVYVGPIGICNASTSNIVSNVNINVKGNGKTSSSSLSANADTESNSDGYYVGGVAARSSDNASYITCTANITFNMIKSTYDTYIGGIYGYASESYDHLSYYDNSQNIENGEVEGIYVNETFYKAKDFKPKNLYVGGIIGKYEVDQYISNTYDDNQNSSYIKKELCNLKWCINSGNIIIGDPEHIKKGYIGGCVGYFYLNFDLGTGWYNGKGGFENFSLGNAWLSEVFYYVDHLINYGNITINEAKEMTIGGVCGFFLSRQGNNLHNHIRGNATLTGDTQKKLSYGIENIEGGDGHGSGTGRLDLAATPAIYVYIQNCINFGNIQFYSSEYPSTPESFSSDKDKQYNNEDPFINGTFKKSYPYNDENLDIQNAETRAVGIGGVFGYCQTGEYFDSDSSNEGVAWFPAVLRWCFNYGNITAIEGAEYRCIGGIIGRNYITYYTSQCFNFGNLNLKGSTMSNVGGIIGRLGFSFREELFFGGEVYFCVNYGKVLTLDTEKTGEIVGYSNQSLYYCLSDNSGSGIDIVGERKNKSVLTTVGCFQGNEASNYLKNVFGFFNRNAETIREHLTALKPDENRYGTEDQRKNAKTSQNKFVKTQNNSNFFYFYLNCHVSMANYTNAFQSGGLTVDLEKAYPALVFNLGTTEEEKKKVLLQSDNLIKIEDENSFIYKDETKYLYLKDIIQNYKVKAVEDDGNEISNSNITCGLSNNKTAYQKPYYSQFSTFVGTKIENKYIASFEHEKTDSYAVKSSAANSIKFKFSNVSISQKNTEKDINYSQIKCSMSVSSTSTVIKANYFYNCYDKEVNININFSDEPQNLRIKVVDSNGLDAYDNCSQLNVSYKDKNDNAFKDDLLIESQFSGVAKWSTTHQYSSNESIKLEINPSFGNVVQKINYIDSSGSNLSLMENTSDKGHVNSSTGLDSYQNSTGDYNGNFIYLGKLSSTTGDERFFLGTIIYQFDAKLTVNIEIVIRPVYYDIYVDQSPIGDYKKSSTDQDIYKSTFDNEWSGGKLNGGLSLNKLKKHQPSEGYETNGQVGNFYEDMYEDLKTNGYNIYIKVSPASIIKDRTNRNLLDVESLACDVGCVFSVSQDLYDGWENKGSYMCFDPIKVAKENFDKITSLLQPRWLTDCLFVYFELEPIKINVDLENQNFETLFNVWQDDQTFATAAELQSRYGSNIPSDLARVQIESNATSSDEIKFQIKNLPKGYSFAGYSFGGYEFSGDINNLKIDPQNFIDDYYNWLFSEDNPDGPVAPDFYFKSDQIVDFAGGEGKLSFKFALQKYTIDFSQNSSDFKNGIMTLTIQKMGSGSSYQNALSINKNSSAFTCDVYYYQPIKFIVTTSERFVGIYYNNASNSISLSKEYTYKDFVEEVVAGSSIKTHKFHIETIDFDEFMISNSKEFTSSSSITLLIKEPEKVNGVYQIDSYYDLLWISRKVSLGTTFENTRFIQTADIDLENKTFYPIGDDSRAFKGIYDGNFYIIKNISMNNSKLLYNVGLFGNTDGATIKNLTLMNQSNVNVTGYSRVGAIAGNAVNTTFVNVNNLDVNLYCYKYATYNFVNQYAMNSNSSSYGGIVGRAQNCSFVGCSSKLGIQNSSACSFVGFFYGMGEGSNLIDQCFAETRQKSDSGTDFIGYDSSAKKTNSYFKDTNNKKITYYVSAAKTYYSDGKNFYQDSSMRQPCEPEFDEEIWTTKNNEKVLKIFYW